MAQGSEGFLDREVATIVRQLDKNVTLRRRAAAAGLSTHFRATPSLPLRPTTIEQHVLAALAWTWGAAVLDDPAFLPALDCVGECGAVVLVQRVLCGDGPADRQLAAQLAGARVAFDILCATWPDVFMAQAHAELQGFRPRPPQPPDLDNGVGRR